MRYTQKKFSLLLLSQPELSWIRDLPFHFEILLSSQFSSSRLSIFDEFQLPISRYTRSKVYLWKLGRRTPNKRYTYDSDEIASKSVASIPRHRSNSFISVYPVSLLTIAFVHCFSNSTIIVFPTWTYFGLVKYSPSMDHLLYVLFAVPS